MADSDSDSFATDNEHINEAMIALKNNDHKYFIYITRCCTPILTSLCRAKALKPYLSAARWIPLGINPYANLTAVFFSGMEQDPEDDVTEPSEM
jgi:hypothetical protein